MRHRSSKFTLGRESAQRDSLMRNLAESLILHGAVKTTKAKAKALRTVVEPLVTKAKTNTLASRRHVAKLLYTEDAVKKLMEEIGPRYKERAGGYTRIVKLGARPRDAAEVVRIEFV
ncbi:MAG TPA: 50S ribosomal protein L17 [Candidatus Kapabacteria bacterium]|nr:50S ribosomal protein L17 [Candidatus Kapabacteria bacterium]